MNDIVRTPSSSSADALVPSRRPHLRALTSLRFFLALFVVFIHYDVQIAKALVPQPFATSTGVCAVTAFFVLSGFILTYQYFREDETIDRANFFRARFARIAPVYWFSMILALAIVPAPDFPAPSWLPAMSATSGLFIQSWFPIPQIYFGFNGPAYTLSVEMFFYALFPFILSSVSKHPMSWALGTIAFSFVLAICATPGMAVFMTIIFPPSRLSEFVIGMAAGLLFLRRKNFEFSHVILFEVLSMALFVGLTFGLAPLLYHMDTPLQVCVLKNSAALLFAVLLFTFALRAGGLSKLLGWAPLVVLGEISYALYLIHDTFCRWLRVTQPNFPFTSTWIGFVVFAALVSGVAFISYILIERPWRSAIVAKRLPRPAPVLISLALMIAVCNGHQLYFGAFETLYPSALGREQIAFGDSVVLQRIHMWRMPQGVQVSAYWRAGSHPSEATNLGVHLLNRSGATIGQLDHSLLPTAAKSDLVWHDDFLVPNEYLTDSKTLALAVFRNPSQTLLIKEPPMNTDWGNHRLLLRL
jgi:peptidoglycan/LPS O-acetylase OafA/YrhL